MRVRSRSGEGRQRRPRSDTSGGGARAAVEMTRPFRAADADARQRRAALSACGAGRASTTIRAEAQSRRPDERFGSGQFDHPGDGQRLEGTRGARAACSRPWGGRRGPARRRARPRGRGSPFAGAEPFAEAGFAVRFRVCVGCSSDPRCARGVLQRRRRGQQGVPGVMY